MWSPNSPDLHHNDYKRWRTIQQRSEEDQRRQRTEIVIDWGICMSCSRWSEWRNHPWLCFY